MRWTLTIFAVLAVCSAGFAQNLLENPSFQDPAYARIRINAAVLDGETVTIDEGGANQRIYEFDTGNPPGIDPGSDVSVNVSASTAPNDAAAALRAAIDGDALSPADAENAAGDNRVYLTWDINGGVGGDGAVNSTTSPSIDAGDFNAACYQNQKQVIGWQSNMGYSLRNGDVFIPPCRDGEHRSLQGTGSSVLYAYQTVSGLDNSKTYLLTGLWSIGIVSYAGRSCTYSAELFDGTEITGDPLASTEVTLEDAGALYWLPFAVAASPTGTNMTVVLRVNSSGGSEFALHLDDLSLVELSDPPCTPPTVDSFSQEMLFRGTDYTNSIVVTGTGFVADQTTVTLKGDMTPDLVATDVVVAPGGLSLTCSLSIPANAPYGSRTVVVEVAGCGGNSLPQAAYVLGSQPFRNGSFELADPGYNQCPVQPQWAPDWWDAVESNAYGYEGELFRDDHPYGAPFLPSCTRDAGQWPPDGYHYAATMSNANGQEHPYAENFIFQTFKVDPNSTYTFSGYFAGGGNNTVTMEMRNGAMAGELLESAEIYSGGAEYDWTFSAISATTPAGATVMTVGWRVNLTGPGPHASYADNIKAVKCTNPTLQVTGITPSTGVNSGVVSITNLAGNSFAGTPQVILTKSGYVVNATSVTVVSANKITCQFDLTGLPSGKYDVLVVQDGCVARLSDVPAAFVVVGASFLNGSFEDPTEAGGCPAGVIGAPNWWGTSTVGEFGSARLYRDGDPFVGVVPACPPPDGDHYATSSALNASGAGGGENRVFQTISVTPAVQYEFSGWFAGRGENNVYIEILNGDQDAVALASTQVHSDVNPGSYDWTYATVVGTPTNNYMTVVYRIELTGSGDHAVHADDMSLTQCAAAITVTEVTPDSGINNGTVSITNLAGTGFDDSGGTPTVILSKTGPVSAVSATSVDVVSPTQITCQFNLTGLPSGKYDIVVTQGGCSASLVGEFLVAATTFVNGSFEEPTADENCGGDTWGRPTGWNRLDRLMRDGSVHVPSCDPLPAGDHYGSMMTGEGDLEQAWQTLSASAGSYYRFAGTFSGGGSNTVKIKLLDGDETGPVLAETTVSTGGGYPWLPFEVIGGPASSNAITAMWEMSGTSGDSATHADALTFASYLLCGDPFADADGDEDVDQEDFGVFQACYTGPGPGVEIEPPPAYCECFERTDDDAIDEQDLNAFTDCAAGSGPGIEADDCCDGGPGC